MQIGKHPYHLLPLASIPFLVIYFIWNDVTLDLHFHDTYYVVPVRLLALVPFTYLLIIWFVYLATHKIMFSRKLIWTHVIFAIVLPYFIFVFPYLIQTNQLTAVYPRRYFDFSEWSHSPFRPELPSSFFRIFFLLLLLGQLTYPVNFFLGLFKQSNR